MAEKLSEVRYKIPVSHKEKWIAFCRSQKVSCPEMFAIVIDRLIGNVDIEKQEEDGNKEDRVNLRLSKKQYAGISKIVEEQGFKNNAQFLRSLIDSVLSGERPIHQATDDVSPKLNRIYLRFTERQYKKIHSLAITQSFENATKYVKSLVLGAITKSPILTEDEINTLRESNRELAAIGRNLNQVAKKLNIEFRDRESLTKQMIEELIETVDEHRDRVSELIEKNLTRWKDL